MKILIVSDFYTPGNSRLLEEYGTQLVDRDHRVGLLAGTDHPSTNAERLRTAGVDPFLFSSTTNRNVFSRLLTRLRAPLKQYDKFRSRLGKPAVVIFNQPLTALPLLINHSFDSTVYVHHGPWAREWSVHHPESDSSIRRFLSRPYRSVQTSLRHRIEGWILDRMDRIVVLSEYMKGEVETNHPDPEIPTPVIVPGGVDPDRFRPGNRETARERLGWTEETVLFTLRRLVHRMGVDRLIESFGRLQETVDAENLRLVVGGTGPEREALEKKASRLNSAAIEFAGFIEDEDLPAYYRAVDLFVLPTRELEGFGLVTLESLASGTPVAATRTGGTEEIISGFDSELFLPDAYTPEAWASHLKCIIRSDRLSEDYRRLCRNYVLENYTWSSAGEKLDALLSELTTGR